MNAAGDQLFDDEREEVEDGEEEVDSLSSSHGEESVENSVGEPSFGTGDYVPAPKFRSSSPVLPDTVTVLVHEPTGGRIYLVGTAHFGEKSQEDVATTIKILIPDSVIIELCPGNPSFIREK